MHAGDVVGIMFRTEGAPMSDAVQIYGKST
jgi:hypothetical protein